jgi:beta-phosphoglucomutase family hydrolase
VIGLPDAIKALLFDLDGVLTGTAELHRQAWKRTFDDFLARRDGPGFRPFTDQDYLAYVDGRPRADGVRTFLESRGVHLPEGEPDDPPGDGTVNSVGNTKNELLLKVIDEEGVRPYAGSRRYLEAARAAGLKIACVTSSANGQAVLKAADLERFIDARVDGITITTQNLRGKPAPDSFLAGAKALGVSPNEAAVFEDALSGVAAGRAGNFGYVVGVNRANQAEALRAHGADVVVDDLADLLEHKA